MAIKSVTHNEIWISVHFKLKGNKANAKIWNATVFGKATQEMQQMFKNSSCLNFIHNINATDSESMKPGTNPKKFWMFSMFFSFTISNGFYADVHQHSYGNMKRTITQHSEQQTTLHSERRQNIQNLEIRLLKSKTKTIHHFSILTHIKTPA